MAVFRLARLVRLRTQMRQLRQHEADALATTAATLAARAQALAAARDRRAADEARAAAAGLLDPALFQVGRGYDAVLADAERRCAADAAAVAAALDAKRAELQHERREERKFLRLEDAHRQRAADEEAHRTSVLLDELAILRHGRTRPRPHADEE
jgi:flagellar export protein FliJ